MLPSFSASCSSGAPGPRPDATRFCQPLQGPPSPPPTERASLQVWLWPCSGSQRQPRFPGEWGVTHKDPRLVIGGARDPPFQAPMSGSLAQTLSCLSTLIGLTYVRLGLRGLTEPPEGPRDPPLSQCHPPLHACWWAFCDQEAQGSVRGGFSLLHILTVLMPQ